MTMLAAVLALALAAGAPPEVTLTAQRPVSRSIDAYPRIAAPATAETALINEELVKADARVKNAARDCNQGSNYDDGQWRREVGVPFRYGDFLSLVAADTWTCTTFSGSFLNTVTYDLTTGEPVDWRKLLLPRVAGDPAQGVGGDASKLSLVVSPILNEVYRRKVLIGMGSDEQSGCANAFERDYTMMLWLDAEREAVAMRGVGFPPALSACAREETLVPDELVLLKSPQRLLDILKAAHAAHAWSAEIRPTGGRARPAGSK